MGEHDGVQWWKLFFRCAAVISVCIFVRLLLLISWSRPQIKKRKPTEKCRIAVFLGSGGHTSEMMQLIQALPIGRYTSRTYIVTTSDRFSMEKALDYEKTLWDANTATSFDFIQLPRARNVHQRWLSTPLSVLLAFTASTYHLVLRPMLLERKKVSVPDAILMNGPGTCVPIVASVYMLRVSAIERCHRATPLKTNVLCARSFWAWNRLDSSTSSRTLGCLP